MLTYIIKSFRGGTSDENDKGIEGSFKYGHGLDIHDRDDVLKCNSTAATILDASTGYFSEGQIGTTVAGLFNFFVPATDGTTYCFGSTGSIFARSGDGIWTFVYNDANGAIKGAAEWEHSSGANYLYWATSTSIARKELMGADVAPDSGTARWTDVTADYKTTLDAHEWHTMGMASGALGIANGNALATLDYDEYFEAIDLNVRPGNIIKCLEERDDYFILGSERLDDSEEGHIWAWIITADNWIQKKRIPVKGVNALISAEMTVLQGGNKGELFYSDFDSAVPLHAIPGGGQVMPGGTAIEDDLALFGFYGGTYPGIWSYGRRMKNRPHALNYEYRLAKTVGGSSISTIAAVAVANGELLVSWGTTDGSTSEYGVDSFSSTTRASAKYEGLEFDAGTPHLKKFFNSVKLIMSPLPSGCSVSVRYKLDKETTGGDSSAGAGWKYAILGSGSTTFSNADQTEAIFNIGDAGNIYEIGVDLTPSGSDTPEILDIVTYLSQESQNYA